MGNPYDGIILIDKNEGESSFGVVRQVRRILGIRKVGHAGTLDPFATGLLIVLLGQGTKLSSYLMSEEKVYRATMRLGIETDTQDPTGRVLKVTPVPELTLKHIQDKTKEFLGEIEQVPPAFSALNVKGRRAYEFARKGLPVVLKKRKVTVLSLDIISVDLPNVDMVVRCSRGTYIRSLVTRLGSELGPGAHLQSLRRMSCGSFYLKDALNLRKVRSTDARRILQNSIIPLREALPHMKETKVSEGMAQKIRQGHQPKWSDLFRESGGGAPRDDYVRVVKGKELVAILRAHYSQEPEGGWLKVRRVFH